MLCAIMYHFFIGIFMTATFQVDLNNPYEVFQRAFNGIINLKNDNVNSSNIKGYFAYSYHFANKYDYNNDKDLAVFLETHRPNNFYIFLIKAGIILEYIDDRLNVLNVKRYNENYNIKTDIDVLNKICSALSQFAIHKISSLTYNRLFEQRLKKFNKSLLSEDEKKTLKLFTQSNKFKSGNYRSNTHYYDIAKNIIIPYFLKLKTLDINSSQLELDMSSLDDYYIIEKTKENINIDVDEFNEEYRQNIKKLAVRSKTIFSKYLNDLQVESNDYIRNNFNIVQYKITKKLPFFFAFENEFGKAIDFDKHYSNYDDIGSLKEFLKKHNFTQKDVSASYLYSGTEDEICERAQKYRDFSDALIIHKAKRAISIRDSLNDCAKDVFIRESNKYNKTDSFPTENEFIQDMVKIYQDLKAINQFKVDCEQKILNEAQLSWELLNGDDIVII